MLHQKRSGKIKIFLEKSTNLTIDDLVFLVGIYQKPKDKNMR